MRKKIFFFFLSFGCSVYGKIEDVFYYNEFAGNDVDHFFAERQYNKADSFCEREELKNIFKDVDLNKQKDICDRNIIIHLLRKCAHDNEYIDLCFDKINKEHISEDLYVPVIIKEGLYLILKKEYARAIDFFLKRKGRIKDSNVLLNVDFYLSFCYFCLKRYSESYSLLLLWYKKGLDLEPSMYCLLILALFKSNKEEDIFTLLTDKRLRDFFTNYKGENNGLLFSFIGDMYLKRQDFTSARENYEKAIKNQIHKDDICLLKIKTAFCCYKTARDNVVASQFFSELSSRDDYIGFLASFYLGINFFQKGEYKKALESFKRIYKSHTIDIGDDIVIFNLFYYALSSLFVGEKAIALNLFNSFLEKYPTHTLGSIAGRIVVELTNPDYDYEDVLFLIETHGARNDKERFLYQRESFNKAIDSYKKKDYKKCLQFCLKVIDYNVDIKVTNAATFLYGETCCNLGRYREALEFFKKTLTHRDIEKRILLRILYSSAYCYFVLEEYDKAIEKLLLMKKQDLFDEAKMLLADCYFKKKEYKKAKDIYIFYSEKTLCCLYKYALSLFYCGDVEAACYVFGKILRRGYFSHFYRESLSYYFRCLEKKNMQEILQDPLLSIKTIVRMLSSQQKNIKTKISLENRSDFF